MKTAFPWQRHNEPFRALNGAPKCFTGNKTMTPTDGRQQGLRRAVAAFVAMAIGLPSAAAQAADCSLEAGPLRAVVKVIDGETLALDDGSEVRLIGALSPRGPDSGSDALTWPPERDAMAALEALVLGKSVELGFAGRKTDRYGRQLAHVHLRDGDSRIWLQEHLLRGGHARAYALRLNFGSNHREDFTANIRPADRKVIEQTGLDLKSLEGRRVRIRGWIEWRGGPAIEVHDRSQIDVLDAYTGVSSSVSAPED